MTQGSTYGSARKIILVVDDDPAIRILIAREFAGRYDVRVAADGAAAGLQLTMLPSPNLILLDVVMPDFDGFAFAARVKADRRLHTIPIMFLTARTSVADMIQGIKSGARAYLTKPFHVDALRQRIEKELS
jgi:DNA-binding response OmpR family regulator